MKQLLKFSLIIIAVAYVTNYFQSCDSKKSNHIKEPIKKEETFVQYVFNLDKNDIRTSASYRIVLDTFKMVVTDSTNGKQVSEQQWTKDTTYLVALQDSVRDSKGKVIVDSLGKPKPLQWYWPQLPPNRLLVDYNKPWPKN
jgi:hypothetical protein